MYIYDLPCIVGKPFRNASYNSMPTEWREANSHPGNSLGNMSYLIDEK